jgi:cytochrome c553
MRLLNLTFAAALLGWAVVADAASAEAGIGQKKSAVCQGCHGSDGVSADANIPKLAGQHADYIIKQIVEFQAQNRRDERMSPMAQAITNVQDARDIAAYFSAQKPMRGNPTKSPKAQLGKKIYENGLPARGIDACAGCHGVDGKGKGGATNNALFPMIGGQHKQYIVKQLNDFKSNKRTTDPTGIMTHIGRKLEKAELDAVAEYVASL